MKGIDWRCSTLGKNKETQKRNILGWYLCSSLYAYVCAYHHAESAIWFGYEGETADVVQRPIISPILYSRLPLIRRRMESETNFEFLYIRISWFCTFLQLLKFLNILIHLVCKESDERDTSKGMALKVIKRKTIFSIYPCSHTQNYILTNAGQLCKYMLKT